MAEKKYKATGKYKRGSTEMLTIKLSSGNLNVKVRLVDHRMVFGRPEWQVAPVAGNGAVWIQEKSFDTGVPWASPSETSGSRHGTGEAPPVFTEAQIEEMKKAAMDDAAEKEEGRRGFASRGLRRR